MPYWLHGGVIIFDKLLELLIIILILPIYKDLYEDIYIINTVYTHEHDKYIITNANKIKLATEIEIQKEFRKVNESFKRLNAKKKALRKVIGLNGQCKLLSNQNKPITEDSNAKPFIESYSSK